MKWWWQLGKRDAEVERELQSELDLEEEEQRERGVPLEEARYAALRAFGNPALLSEQTRAVWGWNALENLLRDVRIGIRTLFRSPGFSVLAVLVMALCIGAATSLFTVMRSVLLRPLPFREPDRLVMIYEHFRDPENNAQGFNYTPVAPADYLDWRAQTHGFEDMAAWYYWPPNLTGEHGELPEMLQASGGSWNRLTDLQHTSSLARQIRTQSEQAEQSRDYRTSLGLVNRYLTLDPGNRQMEDRRDALETLAAHQAAPPLPPPPGEEAGSVVGAQALMEKAQGYFASKDWFSAHYYAQKANLLDPRRTDALRLAAEASQMLAEATTPGPKKDAMRAALYQKKREAYLLLSGGNSLEAYYSFTKLAVLYPQDRDIATYLGIASEEVSRKSFFLDEARRVEALPGVERILFYNRVGADGMEAVAFGRMVQAREGTYFLDVEAMRYDAAGNVAWHFRAPYGKLQDSTILLRCVDRNNAAVQFVPLYLQGTRPAQERAFLRMAPAQDELQFLSTQKDTLADAGPVELWRLRDSLGSFGLSRVALTVQLVMKLVMPFAFLILSLLALPFGWAFRARSGAAPSGFAVLLVPLVPIVLSVLTMLYVYAHRVLLGFAVLAFGFTAALVLGAILQFVLLATALVILAGQSSA